MRVTNAACASDVLGIDDGLTVVQRRVVPAILGYGIANLLVFGGITGKVSEQIGRVVLLGLKGADNQEGGSKGKDACLHIML